LLLYMLVEHFYGEPASLKSHIWSKMDMERAKIIREMRVEKGYS